MSDSKIELQEITYAKRISEFERLCADYTRLQADEAIQINYEGETPIKDLNDYYWRTLCGEVKPLVPKKVNRYKIAAVIALCIIDLQIVHDDDSDRRRRLNADFALYATVSLIGSFPKSLTIKNGEGNTLNDQGLIMLEQYHNWLLAKKPKSFPIFSTAAFLRTLHLVMYNTWPSNFETTAPTPVAAATRASKSESNPK